MSDNVSAIRRIEEQLEQRLRLKSQKATEKKDTWRGLSPSRTARSLVVAVFIHQSQR